MNPVERHLKINDVLTLTISVLAVGLAFWVLLLPRTPHTPRTCATRQAELGVVASVINATGQIPGLVTRLPLGSRVNVNPNMCVVNLNGTPGQGSRGTDPVTKPQ